jgi:hypothetical protein
MDRPPASSCLGLTGILRSNPVPGAPSQQPLWLRPPGLAPSPSRNPHSYLGSRLAHLCSWLWSLLALTLLDGLDGPSNRESPGGHYDPPCMQAGRPCMSGTDIKAASPPPPPRLPFPSLLALSSSSSVQVLLFQSVDCVIPFLLSLKQNCVLLDAKLTFAPLDLFQHLTTYTQTHTIPVEIQLLE